MSKRTATEQAVEQPLDTLKRAEPEQELAEGYVSNAAQARSACEEFADADGDVSS